MRQLEILAKKVAPLSEDEQEVFALTFTFDSNAISGSTLEYRDVCDIILCGKKVAHKSVTEHLETIGHYNAFQHIRKLVAQDTKLSEDVIKSIHSRVVYNGDSSYQLASPLIPLRMQELIFSYYELRKHLPVIRAVAELHTQFIALSPFKSCNGRVARLLANFELMKAGMQPISISPLDLSHYWVALADKSADTMTQLLYTYELNAVKRKCYGYE